MKKVVLLLICLAVYSATFAQNEKREGDDMAAAGNFSGAAMYYRLCMESDEQCLLKLFKLMYDEKIEPETTDELFQLINPLAQQGNVEAQFYLGEMYAKGRGVSKNDAEAVVWYKKSAEQGNANAQNELDRISQQGWGVSQDMQEAKPPVRTEPKSNLNANVDNLHMKETTSRRSNVLFAAGGVSVAAGVAATLLATKPYTEESSDKIIKGKEYNLVYAAAGVVVGGVCIGTGISLKKKARLQPQNMDHGNDRSYSPVYRDKHLCLNLVAYGNEAGLRLTF
jgi:TPR repeat protein